VSAVAHGDLRAQLDALNASLSGNANIGIVTAPPEEADDQSVYEGNYAIFRTFLNPLFSADWFIPKTTCSKRPWGHFILSFELLVPQRAILSVRLFSSVAARGTRLE